MRGSIGPGETRYLISELNVMVPGEGNGEQKVGRGLQGEKLGRVEHERVCVQLRIPQQCVPASLLRLPCKTGRLP